MIAYRMHGPAFDAFDSRGAFLHAGRWHHAGTRVLYAAEHVSLATLETLIHAGGRKIPPRLLTTIVIPDGIAVESADWIDLPESQAFGDRWAAEMRSAVLRVPSIAVNRFESNFVLNPFHADFKRIECGEAREFIFHSGFFLAS